LSGAVTAAFVGLAAPIMGAFLNVSGGPAMLLAGVLVGVTRPERQRAFVDSTESVLATDLRKDLWIKNWKLSAAQLPIAIRAVLLSVFSVRPVSNALEYYRSILWSAASTLAHRRLRLPNEFLSAEVLLSYDGHTFVLNRESQFGYYLCFTEPRTTSFMRARHGGTFLDLGANCGQYAIPLASNFRHVVALEPNPIAANLLRRNLALNGISNVEVLEEAVTAHSESITLFEGRWLSTWGVKPSRTGGRMIKVPSTTLTQLLDTYGPVDLLKIDIEGSERDVVREAESHLATVACVVLETLSREVVQTLVKAGFRLTFLESWWRPRENILAFRASA